MDSCRKKEADNPYTKILGRWKLAKTGADYNNNGIIASDEMSNVSASQDYEYLFNNDGTGTLYASYNGKKEPDEPFQWYIKYDSVWIGGKFNDTTTFFIVNNTASDLTLTKRSDHAQGIFEWLYFVRK